MASKPKSYYNDRKFTKARTLEEKETQLGLLAYDLVEKKLRDDTATAQERLHFLKINSTREHMEKDILSVKRELAEAQTKSLRSADEIKELYSEAMKMYGIYSGKEPEDE